MAAVARALKIRMAENPRENPPRHHRERAPRHHGPGAEHRAPRILRNALAHRSRAIRRRRTHGGENRLAGKRAQLPTQKTWPEQRTRPTHHIRLFRRARELGYEIELHYLWLSSPAQAIARVRQRVQQGGHHVPAADIRRRFKRSLAHLPDDYLPLATCWAVWDSRSLPAKRLAISGADAIETVRHLTGL